MSQVWSILRLVPGGDGFTRLPDGRAGFARGALPQDRIRPTRLEERRGYVRAIEWELVEAGSPRVEPTCPIADRCGGCDWMSLDRRAELSAKASILREALVRTGGFRDLPDELSIVTAGDELRYRSRLRLHVGQNGKLGLFARGSHELVELPGCVVCLPELERAVLELHALAARHPSALLPFSTVEVRVAPVEPAVVLYFVGRGEPGPLPTATLELMEALRQRFGVSLEEPAGDEHDQLYPLPGGVSLRAPPGVFTQVNWKVNRELVGAVVEGARARGIASFLDLYAGAGNFSLPLLAAGLRGIGVDHSARAIQAARRAARAAGLAGEFVSGDVAEILTRLVRENRQFDLVLLDPPRTGAKLVLATLTALAPRYVAVCGCDPVTLARDLRTLGATHALEDVRGFDMFPRTHHLEALAWMRRSGRVEAREGE